MSASRRGQGFVAVSGMRALELAKRKPHHKPGPRRPGVIFARSDHPFTGEGQQVSLHAEPGYTKPGKLSVPFRFQLPPHEAIARTASFTWSNFDVLDPEHGASERTRPGGPRLRTVQVSTMFLDWEPSYQVWSPDVLSPILAARELERTCLDGVRFRLKIRNPRLYGRDDVNWMAVLTQCTVTEEPGEPDTRYLQLQFQEYRATEVERRGIRNELGPWTHTVAKGDTLHRLAKRYYKRQSDWKRIAQANKGMEHLPPSGDLLRWAKRHKRKSIRVPQRKDAAAPVVRG